MRSHWAARAQTRPHSSRLRTPRKLWHVIASYNWLKDGLVRMTKGRPLRRRIMLPCYMGRPARAKPPWLKYRRLANKLGFHRLLYWSLGRRSWEVLHHATNTEATVCEHLQQSGVCKHEATIRRHVQSNRTTLLLFRLAGSDCRLRFAGLWPSGAVTRPKLLQSRKARIVEAKAEG